jgi:hypothetical protein
VATRGRARQAVGHLARAAGAGAGGGGEDGAGGQTTQFSYRLVSHGVEVYSTLIYAAMHQFGINPRVREGDRYSSTGKTNGPRFHRDDVAGGPRAGRLPALY